MGNSWGKSWENHGENVRKLNYANYGISSENIGKMCENMRKSTRKYEKHHVKL